MTLNRSFAPIFAFHANCILNNTVNRRKLISMMSPYFICRYLRTDLTVYKMSLLLALSKLLFRVLKCIIYQESTMFFYAWLVNLGNFCSSVFLLENIAIRVRKQVVLALNILTFVEHPVDNGNHV